jgi:hypothetical protein
MFPSGVEEGVMFAVAPGLERVARAAGRSGADKWVGEEALGVGLVGAGGEDGEGLPKSASESMSASGVVTGEAMAVCVSRLRPLVLARGTRRGQVVRRAEGVVAIEASEQREVRCCDDTAEKGTYGGDPSSRSVGVVEMGRLWADCGAEDE